MLNPKCIPYSKIFYLIKYCPENEIKKQSTIPLPFQFEARTEVQIVKLSEEGKQ